MRDERIDAHIHICVTLVDGKQLFPKRGRCHKVPISRNRIHREEKTESKSEELLYYSSRIASTFNQLLITLK